MNGKELKKKFPEWCEKHKIKDRDVVYLVGDKLKILRTNQ